MVQIKRYADVLKEILEEFPQIDTENIDKDEDLSMDTYANIMRTIIDVMNEKYYDGFSEDVVVCLNLLQDITQEAQLFNLNYGL